MGDITHAFSKQSFSENHVSFENVCRLPGTNQFQVCLKRSKAAQLLKRQFGSESDLVAVVWSIFKCNDSQRKTIWALILHFSFPVASRDMLLFHCRRIQAWLVGSLTVTRCMHSSGTTERRKRSCSTLNIASCWG